MAKALQSKQATENTWQDSLDYDSNGNFTKEESDDGVAFLRVPGAFLSPNHFKIETTCEDFTLFSGCNIILTSELIQLLLSCDDNYFDPNRVIKKATLLYDLVTTSVEDPDVLY